MKTTAVYPGTFDPITNGHVDIITRASQLFSKVIIAIAPTSRKNTFFTIENRVDLAKAALKSIANIEVVLLKGLVVDIAKAEDAVILRGLRNGSDFDYEFQLAEMNRQLSPKTETIFLSATAEYAPISATIVREIIELGGDVSAFVPKAVLEFIQQKRKS